MSGLVLLQFLCCPLVLLLLLRTTAPYGRHYSAGWGPTMPNRMAWFLMELPALLIIGLVLSTSGVELSRAALASWLMWSLHYSYRTFVFPALMRPSGQSFPVLLVLFAIAFNTLNGYNNGQALLANALSREPFPSFHFVIGTLLFIGGAGLHISSDRTIRQLRHNGFHGYRVPQGWCFDRVTNPNYLGEILQWTGWAVLTWSWAGLAFAVFTFCNLAPRALANHRWYRENFPDYPLRRRILIPGIF